MILSKEAADNLRTMRKKRTTINQVIIRKKDKGSKELGIISDKVIDLIYETSHIYEVDEECLDTRVFEDLKMVSDEVIDLINKTSPKIKIDKEYKNRSIF